MGALSLVALLVFVFGSLGGAVNGLISGELKAPRRNPNTGSLKPGWVGDVIVGGIAALVVWGLYGDEGSIYIVNNGVSNAPTDVTASLRIFDIMGSLLIGAGGGRLLKTELATRGLSKENKALKETNATVIRVARDLSEIDDSEESA